LGRNLFEPDQTSELKEETSLHEFFLKLMLTKQDDNGGDDKAPYWG